METVVIVGAIAYIVTGPFVSAWLAVKMCRTSPDCPWRQRDAVKRWHAELERQRTESPTGGTPT